MRTGPKRIGLATATESRALIDFTVDSGRPEPSENVPTPTMKSALSASVAVVSTLALIELATIAMSVTSVTPIVSAAAVEAGASRNGESHLPERGVRRSNPATATGDR